jgi:hypothetical protein
MIDDGDQCSLSKRDYIATRAMQSLIVLLGSGLVNQTKDKNTEDLIAKQAYYFADAMLKVRTEPLDG